MSGPDGTGDAAQKPVKGLVVHALTVGGGTLALASLPGRGGDYRGDLEVFHEWRPGIVLTLVSEAELVEVGGAAIGNDIQSMGSRWHHLPIQDFGTPDEAVMARWPEASRQVRRALKGGGRVIVHCRGGCGRSGMVALRLMVECGEDRFAALNRLRALRDCAVETKGQLKWAFEAEAIDADARDPAPVKRLR